MSRSRITQTRRVGPPTPEQPVIPQCRSTTLKKRSRYYPPYTTSTRWYFSSLLVDLVTKTDW
ncbi:unnamed protein product [Hymenolepis diminuta]|uniref:Uncharacterized protein n=1 Tax=Hymenolepis diminuta TaxID=6216 RepID=A0A564YIB4_HYMDI|nr:unnamed protein product [Hymenolepis diminuta]